MNAQIGGYELVRVVGRDDFRSIGTITDGDEAVFLQRLMNERCEGRVYLLRPVQQQQRRTE